MATDIIKEALEEARKAILAPAYMLHEIPGTVLVANQCEAALAAHEAREKRLAELEELVRKAEQLAYIATDWHLEEVEIDGEMVSTYELGDEFRAALNKEGE